ncbi:hypothetical protein [Amycolatopsis sp. NPDC001319]|uniref:hypothetical protein n=1 Tax=unclassified Amycolatopsis TaxID=2618356 RepID=UPI0036819756
MAQLGVVEAEAEAVASVSGAAAVAVSRLVGLADPMGRVGTLLAIAPTSSRGGDVVGETGAVDVLVTPGSVVVGTGTGMVVEVVGAGAPGIVG